MNTMIHRCLSLLILILLATACTRQVEQTTSSLTFSSSQSVMAAPSGYTLSRIMVNVRGPGIAKVIEYVWDKHNTNASAPTSIPLEVPSGSDRLIQYLAVYQNDNDIMVFNYSDTTVALAPGPQEVELIANSYGVAGMETTVAGRLVRADGSFPSGPVRLEFSPPNGKPNMIVEHMEIFGGWFSWFTFDNVPFTYVLESNEEVLFNAITSNNIRPLSNNTPTMLIKVPEHFSDYGMGCDNTRLEPEKRVVFGYFGSGATSLKTCFKATTPSSTGLYQNSSGNCGSSYSWSTTRISEGTALPGVILGGYASSDTANVPSCSADLAANQMMFPYTRLKNGGKDRLVTNGPFKFDVTTAEEVTFSGNNSTSFTMTWTLAPDTTSGAYGVKGVEVYKRNYGVSSISARTLAENKALVCSEAAAQAGYTLVVDKPVISGFSHVFSGTVGANDYNSDAQFNQGDYNLVLCPYAMVNGVKFPFKSMVERYGYATPVALLAYDSGTFTDTNMTSYLDKTITISNATTVNATGITSGSLTSPFAYVGGTYPGTGGTCSTSLAANNATCTLKVRFSPSTHGDYNQNLVLNFNNGVSGVSLTVPLVAKGLGADLSVLTPASANGNSFTANGTIYNMGQMVVKNVGNATATLSAPSGLMAPFAISSTTCGATLAANATCEIYVTFSPSSSTGGPVTQTLSIGYSGSGASGPLDYDYTADGI